MKVEEKVVQNLARMADASGLPDYKICNLAGVGHAQLSKARKNPAIIDPGFLLKMRDTLKCSYTDFFMLGNRMLQNLLVKDIYLKRIKARRLERNVTEQQAAQALGVRVNTFITFEKHGFGIAPDKFEALIEYLGIEPEYLAPSKKRKNKQTKEQPLPEEALNWCQSELAQQDLFCDSSRVDELEKRVSLLEGFLRSTFKQYDLVEKAVNEIG